ncbi:agamous-like MADS-box protein AGL80 [Prunus yedoensis var. nudiflora]|uniref:Agamous-like MADS-box protein AGL80 n=1 Tax=Prunus yedoensis var. nudiflora TaxID=2094558 RepID=A0A314UZD4_PRUYE|nr:agamous-like MADS-box protein AGL80 [Prunus yedoensis var. nudiflora]
MSKESVLRDAIGGLLGREAMTLELSHLCQESHLQEEKGSLFRKLTEITTLCGIIACAVVYDPSDSKMDAWPSPQEAFYVLENFKKLPEQRRGQFMMDQKAF